MKGVVGALARALRRGRRCFWATVLVSLAWVSPTWAWAPSGHMQIALLAYDALPAELRQSLVRLLEAHPRFPEDFLPHVPPDLKSVADRDRWIFAHAATWPDLARGQPAYEHGTWHYVNLPLYLRGGRLVSCAEARAAFPESVRKIAERQAAEGASAGGAQDSIREALPKALGVLGDVTASATQRGLALSWVLHLVGDAHQPLHGVALFTEKRFVTGDRGGNDIIITQRGSLHRLWDGLLGEETSLGAVSNSAARLRATRHPMKPAPLAAQDLDLDHWLDEGCEIARNAVYVPAVLNAVQMFERRQREGKPEVALRKEYVEAAAEAARRRAIQAGARLARMLELSALPRAQLSSEPDLRPRP